MIKGVKIILISLAAVGFLMFISAVIPDEIETFQISDNETGELLAHGDSLIQRQFYTFKIPGYIGKEDELRGRVNWKVGDHMVFDEVYLDYKFSEQDDFFIQAFVDHQLKASDSVRVIEGFAKAIDAVIPLSVTEDQPVEFADKTRGAKSWSWVIHRDKYQTQNVNHTFTRPGKYEVQLVVETSNDTLFVAESVTVNKKRTTTSTTPSSSSTSTSTAVVHDPTPVVVESSTVGAWNNAYGRKTNFPDGAFEAVSVGMPDLGMTPDGCEYTLSGNQFASYTIILKPKKILALDKLFVHSTFSGGEIDFELKCTDCEGITSAKTENNKVVSIDEEKLISVNFRKLAGMKPGFTYELKIKTRGVDLGLFQSGACSVNSKKNDAVVVMEYPDGKVPVFGLVFWYIKGS